MSTHDTPTTHSVEPGEQEVQDSLDSVVTALLQQSQMQQSRAYEAVAHASAFVKAREYVERLNVDGYHFTLPHELSKAQHGLLETLLPGKHEVHFIFMHSEFVRNQFEAFIKKHEGGICCADKSSFLTNAVLRYYALGAPIVLNREQQYTFHLPTKVFVQEAEILGFFQASYGLFYGRVHQYLDHCNELEARLGR